MTQKILFSVAMTAVIQAISIEEQVTSDYVPACIDGEVKDFGYCQCSDPDKPMLINGRCQAIPSCKNGSTQWGYCECNEAPYTRFNGVDCEMQPCFNGEINTETNKCECKEGDFKDYQTCRPKTECTESGGTAYDSNCTCPRGGWWDTQAGKCVSRGGSFSRPPAYYCADGEWDDTTQQCVCEAGQVFDGFGCIDTSCKGGNIEDQTCNCEAPATWDGVNCSNPISVSTTSTTTASECTGGVLDGSPATCVCPAGEWYDHETQKCGPPISCEGGVFNWGGCTCPAQARRVVDGACLICSEETECVWPEIKDYNSCGCVKAPVEGDIVDLGADKDEYEVLVDQTFTVAMPVAAQSYMKMTHQAEGSEDVALSVTEETECDIVKTTFYSDDGQTHYAVIHPLAPCDVAFIWDNFGTAERTVKYIRQVTELSEEAEKEDEPQAAPEEDPQADLLAALRGRMQQAE